MWLQKILWECTLPLPGHEVAGTRDSFSIYRLKGRLLLESGRVKMVQGVREVFEVADLDNSNQGDDESSSGLAEAVKGKLVLIGRGIAGQPWEDSLDAAIGGRTQ